LWMESQPELSDADSDTCSDEGGPANPKFTGLCAGTVAPKCTLIWWLVLTGLLARRRV
jgi:hypothetical protein